MQRKTVNEHQVKALVKKWDGNGTWGLLEPCAYEGVIPYDGDLTTFREGWTATRGEGLGWVLAALLTDGQKTMVVLRCIELDGLAHTQGREDDEPESSEDDEPESSEGSHKEATPTTPL